jgi:hypothetical protein
MLACLVSVSLLVVPAQAVNHYPYAVAELSSSGVTYMQQPRQWHVEPLPTEGHHYMFYNLAWSNWGRAVTTTNGMLILCTEQLTQCQKGTVTVRLSNVEPGPERHEYCWMTIARSSIPYIVGAAGNVDPLSGGGLCKAVSKPTPSSGSSSYNLTTVRRQAGEVSCANPQFHSLTGIRNSYIFEDHIGCKRGLTMLENYVNHGTLSSLPGWYCTGMTGNLGTLILCRTGVNPNTEPQNFDIVNASTPHVRAWAQ